MKNDSGFLQASGFLFKKKLSFDWARDSPASNQNAIKALKNPSLLIEK
ncbi:MAG: hypothetical protein RMY16_14800 [Nostoc sp. DedQUE12b]|nr:hypothetical protein [Nostoc sp. DedQUE12b]MDZ8086806.1 hypothetical protein [Nostoc sp. DedQUE12b]